MFLIIGSLVVTGCVIGSYVALGGKLAVLWQPLELVIIGGSGIGAYIIANPKTVLVKSISGILSILKGPKYKKDDYVELLSLLYQVFRLAKTKGMLALESHVENPQVRTAFIARDQCLGCHDRENSPTFDYDTYWARINHGAPADGATAQSSYFETNVGQK